MGEKGLETDQRGEPGSATRSTSGEPATQEGFGEFIDSLGPPQVDREGLAGLLGQRRLWRGRRVR
jgi:hypothetical protein